MILVYLKYLIMSGEGTTSINNLPTDNIYDPNANIVMELLLFRIKCNSANATSANTPANATSTNATSANATSANATPTNNPTMYLDLHRHKLTNT